MKVEFYGDVVLCEECGGTKAAAVLASGMVGPGTVFANACPHVEVAFLRWHDAKVGQEPPRARHVLPPLLAGFLAGFALAFSFWGMP